MNDLEIEGVLVKKLAETRGATREEVLEELKRLGEIDSLEGLELITEAERVFEISVSDKELSSDMCRSLSTIVALVQSKTAPASATNEGDAER